MPWESAPPSTELSEGDRVRLYFEFTLPDFWQIDDFIAEAVDDVFLLQNQVNAHLAPDEELDILDTDVTNLGGGDYELMVEHRVEHASPLAISGTAAAVIAAVALLVGFGIGLTLTGSEKFVAGAAAGGLGVALLGFFVLQSLSDDDGGVL